MHKFKAGDHIKHRLKNRQYIVLSIVKQTGSYVVSGEYDVPAGVETIPKDIAEACHKKLSIIGRVFYSLDEYVRNLALLFVALIMLIFVIPSLFI